MFEQRSRLGGGYPARIVFSSGAQEPIRRCCAHGEQLASTLLREVEVPVPLQRFNEGEQKRDEPFGTDLIGSAPCLMEGVLDRWSIVNGTRMRDARP